MHAAHAGRYLLDLIDHLLAELQINDWDYLWHSMLNWEQVQTMHREGITFGSHTVTHPILSRISLAEAREEIVRSKTTIEGHLDCAVDLFAYPAGTARDYTEEIKKLLWNLGFKAAVTTVFGSNTATTDRLELRRNWMLVNPSITEFAAKILWYKFAS